MYEEDEFRKELEQFSDRDDEDEDEDDIFKEEKDEEDDLFGTKKDKHEHPDHSKEGNEEEKPVKFRCLECRHTFTAPGHAATPCPDCGALAKPITDGHAEDEESANAASGKTKGSNVAKGDKGKPAKKAGSKPAQKTATKSKPPKGKKTAKKKR